jgi:hypothetical protein
MTADDYTRLLKKRAEEFIGCTENSPGALDANEAKHC